jgi:hypothetical protein
MTLSPSGGREYQPMSFGVKNLKRGREKGENCKRKREERVRKGKKK